MSLELVRVFGVALRIGMPVQGLRRFGVPPGGAFDRESLLLANALAEAPEEAEAWELGMANAVLRTCETGMAAVVGAPAAVSVDGRIVACQSAFPVPSGAEIHVSPPESGARTYVAFRAGVRGRARRLAMPPSTLEGRVVRIVRGPQWDLLQTPFPALYAVNSSLEQAAKAIPLPEPALRNEWAGEVGELAKRERGTLTNAQEVHQLKWTSPALPLLQGEGVFGALEGSFEVGLSSNRVGIRLEGAVAPHEIELPSEPACLGAIQVARDGTLLVLGPDGPTIGGYPKIGVVIDADLDRLGQLRPGESVAFEEVTLQEAKVLRHQRHLSLQRQCAELRAAGL